MLEESLNSPKRTRVQMDRKHRIEGLKEYIREMEKPLALENNEMLQVYCTNETPSKPINEWTFPKIELIESENGRRNLDYGIESRRKRKAEERGFDKVWGL
ncbi:hypothetical protein GLOIN_2v1774909 [Rhizophagus clarus]|uniref:Uncharacterized protein n=1 Tax=Rhizophagus clarus TaxID=94130 RepID=A0A8H3M4F1_9GLOM|nr:hypothetical protein GLOIN_2v1774909 [Rhizophagus clarus]